MTQPLPPIGTYASAHFAMYEGRKSLHVTLDFQDQPARLIFPLSELRRTLTVAATCQCSTVQDITATIVILPNRDA